MGSNFRKMHSALADAYMVLVKAHMDRCPIPTSELVRVITTIESSLAIKPRNCDVGTAEEQYKMWQVFCNKYDDDCTGCQCDGPTCTLDYCFAKWLQMPYEAEEGGVTDGVQSAS